MKTQVCAVALDTMRVFLTGVACVGKATIGSILASRIGCRFYDLDLEIERFFKTSIERLRNQFITNDAFRNEAARALMHVLGHRESRDCVIALPPSGLMGAYLRVLKRAGGTTVVLIDTPENILNGITFYDIESRPIEKHLTEKEKRLYLREIKKDITYYRQSYGRADLRADICGLAPDAAAERVRQSLEQLWGDKSARAQNPGN